LLNREIIAIDQDPMGVAARLVLTQGGCDIYMRRLPTTAQPLPF
jgi:hypothetical protein